MSYTKILILLIIDPLVTFAQNEDCEDVVLLTTHGGSISSPNYPHVYDHNLNCRWTIQAPIGHFVQIKFSDFDVKNPFFECTHDYVIVNTGRGKAAKYCNARRPPKKGVVSKSNSVKVRFKTDVSHRNGFGFIVKYDIVDGDGHPLQIGKDATSRARTQETTIATSTAVSPNWDVSASSTKASMTSRRSSSYTETSGAYPAKNDHSTGLSVSQASAAPPYLTQNTAIFSYANVTSSSKPITTCTAAAFVAAMAHYIN